MIPDTKNRYLITFDYSFLNQIDNILSKNQIIQQTFEKNISYLIELEKENENKVLSSLVLVTLKQIKMEDAIQADEIFQLLMGEEVEPRRKFIEDNAVFATDLDI